MESDSTSCFIYVVACVRMSFFLRLESYATVCMSHLLFIQSPIDPHGGRFHLLTVVNKAAIWVHKHLFKPLLSVLLCTYLHMILTIFYLNSFIGSVLISIRGLFGKKKSSPQCLYFSYDVAGYFSDSPCKKVLFTSIPTAVLGF